MRIDPALRPGLAFMTLHFPDEVDTNVLTIDATDPKSGTAEFKAAAIRVEKLDPRGRQESRPGRGAGGCALSAAGVDRADGSPSARRRADARRSAPPSTRCSARPPPAGRAARDASRPTATSAHGGHAARAQRHLLLPALHALQERVGWISPGALNYVCQRLTVPPADAYGVATFYALFSLEPRPPRVVHVCDDIACRCRGRGRAQRRARAAASGPRARSADELRRRGCAARASASASGRRRRSLTDAGDAAERARARARRRRRRRARRSTGATPCDADPPPTAAAAAASRRCGCSRRVGRVDPREPRRLPRARRLRGAAPGVRARPGGRDPRGASTRSSSAAAAPRSRPAASGRRSRASRRARTTWSATPTSPSPARSRTAC